MANEHTEWCNIINNQGNINKSHDETPLYPRGNDWKKKIDNTKWGEGLEQAELSHTAGGNVKWLLAVSYKV